MPIRLDILKDRKNADAYRKFSYADLKLDLDLNSHMPSTPVGVSKNPVDFRLSYDENAIFNSIRNIFNTKKGQKILNPTFGLDLEMFLFDNISKENADIIGKTIYEELPIYEPRIIVDSVNVIARPDDNEYEVSITIIIPSLDDKAATTTGILTEGTFNYI
jgi:phage baseplate assembly protein W